MAIAGLASVLAVGGVSLAPTSDAATFDCKELMLYFGRGTGGWNSTSRPEESGKFFGEIRSRLPSPGWTIAEHEAGEGDGYEGHDYKAAGELGDLAYAATISDETNGVYYESVNDGVAEVLAYLNDRASACPDEQWILGGYSQGAHVIGNVLRHSSLSQSARDHIAFVTFFGDPKFQQRNAFFACTGHNDPWVRGSVSCLSFGGALLRGNPKYVPDDLRDRIGSWCNSGDPVCDADLDHLLSSGVHSEYPKDAIPDAALEAVEHLRERNPSRPDSEFNLRVEPLTVGTAGLDVSVLVDTTGSMSPYVGSAQSSALSIAQKVFEQPNGRVSLVQYKDHGDSLVSQIEVPFTRSAAAFQAGVDVLGAAGGGDTPEAVNSAFMTAFNDLSWQFGATKIAVVIADAEGHDPEPVTGYTSTDVLQAALKLDPVAIYPLIPNSISYFQHLADESGGEVFTLGSDVGASFDQILEEVRTKPLVVMGGPYFAAPDDVIRFDASRSYDPDSTIEQYEWDFDADGTVDQTTTDGIVEHAFGSPFTGQTKVTVHSADGGVAIGSASVLVAADAISRNLVNAVQNLTVVPGHAGEAIVRWDPPSDGAAPTGYSIRTSTGSTTEVTGTTVSFTGLVGQSAFAVAVQPVAGDLLGPISLGGPIQIKQATNPPASTPLIKGRCGKLARSGSFAVILGTSKNDVLEGSAKREIFVARGGDDVIRGRGGDDVVCAGAGNDRADAGKGKDRIFGGRGADKLAGGGGDDVLIGGPGDDSLSGGPGRDILKGGRGADRLRGADADRLIGGPGDDRPERA